MIVNNVKIGDGSSAYLIAEVAQSHDGSLGMAHSFIDSAAAFGANAIKFQTHIASAESTYEEPFRKLFGKQDETRFDYWKRMEFSPDQWRELAKHCNECGITFLSSPFSIEAVQLLSEIGMSAWKVGSGEFFSTTLLNAIADTKKPIFLSTGMSSWKEIDAVTERLQALSADFVLFQCTSKYPVNFDEVGINNIIEMRQRYGCPIGISDHSGTVFPSLLALGQGCDVIEVHVTFDKKMFGPDVAASITFPELKFLRDSIDNFYVMMSSPVDKDFMSQEMAEMRQIFTKSLALRKKYPKGHQLKMEDLTVKKPGTGIPESSMASVVGLFLKNDVDDNRLLAWEDLTR